ncbi:MAG: ribosome-associated translation inhibitor RaiA [Erysipelotrichaceae bacterium]|mgnify:FL=1|nr:ribosome-associated translation inhibitor RaiA [Erysipelotrichaceae bacterium]
MMEVLVRGNKIDITDAMKDYVKEKLSKLDKYTLDDTTATVLVKIRNYSQKVEVTIPLKTLMLRAEDESQDFYSAVDLVVNKLERQIRKNKSKLKKREKSGIKEFNIDDITDNGEDELVIKRKKIDIKPMNLDEAILQMELLGHNFYMYKDSDIGRIALVYKRNDGGYGVIEEE